MGIIERESWVTFDITSEVQANDGLSRVRFALYEKVVAHFLHAVCHPGELHPPLALDGGQVLGLPLRLRQASLRLAKFASQLANLRNLSLELEQKLFSLVRQPWYGRYD